MIRRGNAGNIKALFKHLPAIRNQCRRLATSKNVDVLRRLHYWRQRPYAELMPYFHGNS
jgi:hypothetical protein